MGVIDDVKDQIDIVALVGETVKLRKTGKNHTGFCPFHPNTRTPAFVVFQETGTWRCFGACNEGGDVFSYVMKKEGWDFREALAFLADRAGIELEPQTPERQAEEQATARLRELLEAAVTFYRHHLLETSAGAPVLSYLRQRDLKDAIIEAFEIGYAPDSWDSAHKFLLERGFGEDEMLQAGMVSERETGGVYDRFRHRIMFPIRTGHGRLAGFGARVVNPEDVPKFLNSPQTVLFDKGRLLYGLDKARKPIRSADQSVLVEGYLDVIALHQAGFANSVSPMGTAITDHHLRQLKRFSRRMILALDADAAGLQATLRGLTVAREALERESDPIFDARGLVGHEERLDAEIRIITLPPGMDPDEVVAADPQAWPKLVAGARTVVDYVLETLISTQESDDPKVKAQIAGQVLPLIEDVADPVEREAYRQSLARQLKVDERALLNWRPRPARRASMVEQASDPAGQAGGRRLAQAGSVSVERFCLGALLSNPEVLYRVDRELQALSLDRLESQDFTGSDRQVIFRAVRSALSQEEQEPAQHWRAALPEPLLQMAIELAGQLAGLDLGQPKVLEELLAGFLRLRKRSQDERFSHLLFELREAQEEDPGPGLRAGKPLERLTLQVQKLTQQRAQLDGAIARYQGAMHNPSSSRRW